MELECATIARLIYDLRQEEIDELIKGILTPRDIMLAHDRGILVILFHNLRLILKIFYAKHMQPNSKGLRPFLK